MLILVVDDDPMTCKMLKFLFTEEGDEVYVASNVAGARAFLRQDGRMVDLQNQGLRYDPGLIWIDDADRQAKWYQQLKREWAASRREQRPFVNPVEPATLRWRS